MRSGKGPFPAPSDAERAERAAAVLRPLERQVLVLSARDGLRNAEIAARLGISGRRAERILVRALRRFDRALHKSPRPWWRFWSR
jgi:DNA-directed RNA polymerase specialized sigma24 family protein